MNDPLLSDPVIAHLLAWAEAREDIRAVILTSTRTNPNITPDLFSDYDVMLMVPDVRPFFEDRAWLEDFGSVLVLYRDPIIPTLGCERFAYITQYAGDRLKIDFMITQMDWLRRVVEQSTLPDELDVGYRVLLDKDGLTADLRPPTYRAHIPERPSEAVYRELVEVFLHEATYVAKHLWRDDLIPAKHNLDYEMKEQCLRRMLEWLFETECDWSVKPGAYGKGLKKRVPPDLWAALERTYVGAGTAENWDALFATIDLFRTAAERVGERLGYTYPDTMHQRTVAYLREVKALPARINGR